MALTTAEINELLERKLRKLSPQQRRDAATAIHNIWLNNYEKLVTKEQEIRAFLTKDRNDQKDEVATQIANQLNADPELATKVDALRV